MFVPPVNKKQNTDPLLSTIESLASTISFESVLNQSNEVKDKNTKIVHVGGMNYQILDAEESDFFGVTPEALKKKEDEVKAEPQGEKTADQNPEGPKSPMQGAQEQVQKPLTGIHPGITIRLIPIDASDFFSKLPHSLRSFIKESVEIIKSIQFGTQNPSYLFKFDKLDLQVQFESKESSLHIQIASKNADLLKELEDNRKELMIALQKEFKEDIELVIVSEIEQPHASGNETNSQNQENKKSQKEESADDEESN